MLKIIALGHQKNTGKDTACRFLISYIRSAYKGVNVERRTFASLIKHKSHELFFWAGVEDELFYENKPHLKEVVLPLINKSPRDCWIHVGNTIREICDRTWVYLTFPEALGKEGSKEGIIIVPDLRFKVENIGLSELAGKPNVSVYRIKLDRDVKRGLDPAETELLDYHGWDFTINNNLDLRNLNQSIVKIADEILAA